MWALCRVWSATSIPPPHPGWVHVRCSCCNALTNRACAIRSCSDLISPPSCPIPPLLYGGWPAVSFTARIDHRYIVGALRARRTVWLLLSHLLLFFPHVPR